MKTTHERENPLTKRREPFNFLLWLGIASSVMIFTVLLGVYGIRKASPSWINAPLPPLFIYSTLVIIVSSLTLHLAKYSLKTDRFRQYRLYVGTTLALGVLFVVLQLLGWKQLLDGGNSLNNNPSVAFIYLISGLHILHILGGLVALGWAFYQSIKNFSYVDSFIFSVNPPNQLRLRLITVYWHFVDVLWLLLFAFLLVQHA